VNQIAPSEATTTHQRSAQFEGPVSGRLSGNLVQLSLTSRYEASTICYFFDGEIHGGRMSGTAILGAASDQNQGVVNRKSVRHWYVAGQPGGVSLLAALDDTGGCGLRDKAGR
jgi:hypothetical protein